MNGDSKMLVGLSQTELEALADGVLVSRAQAHLNELLARNEEHKLSAEEDTQRDRLLERVDQLTLLKTRAKYTLQHHVRPNPSGGAWSVLGVHMG